MALPIGGWGTGLPGPAGPAGTNGTNGLDGDPGGTGPAGPAPAGTGLVSVTDGVLDTPSTLSERLASEATAVKSAAGILAVTATGATAADARASVGVQDGPRYTPLGGYVDVDATQGTRVIGGSPEALDPAAHAITGRTQTWTLILLASVVSGQTGTIELYDLTDASVAATISVTSATAGTAHTASVTLPGSARRYELRASCTGSTAAHYVTVLNTTLKQSWS